MTAKVSKLVKTVEIGISATFDRFAHIQGVFSKFRGPKSMGFAKILTFYPQNLEK